MFFVKSNISFGALHASAQNHPYLQPTSPEVSPPSRHSFAHYWGAIGAASHSPSALAQQTSATQAIRSYDIPAGPLSQALTRYSREAGIYLAGNSRIAQGKQSQGLKGSYTVEAGLAALLASSGLEAYVQPDGSYGLRTAKAGIQESKDDPATLATVTVTENAVRSADTEGAGSYAATGPLTTATRLPMTLRETPQTISVMTRQCMDDEGIDSIETVLDRTPGISVQNIDASRFSILSRGYDNMTALSRRPTSCPRTSLSPRPILPFTTGLKCCVVEPSFRGERAGRGLSKASPVTAQAPRGQGRACAARCSRPARPAGVRCGPGAARRWSWVPPPHAGRPWCIRRPHGPPPPHGLR